MKIILGLGSNLGDREKNLHDAISLIERDLLKNIKKSSIIETPALLPENADATWNISFLNMVICGNLQNEILPQDFLHKIKLIEKNLGRKPSARWAPREIDIDILAWGNEIFESDILRIPHPSIMERDFVKIPMREIYPEWVHPKSGEKI